MLKILLLSLELETIALRLVTDQGFLELLLVIVVMCLEFMQVLETLPAAFMLTFVTLSLELLSPPLVNLSLLGSESIPVLLIILLPSLELNCHNLIYKTRQAFNKTILILF